MGASAETVQKAVIVPLEEAINGVEHMTYMESSASSGSASINIYFKQGTDPDQAAVNVQNKVSEAQGQLPSEVTKIGVTVEKRQISTLAMIGVYSPDDSFDETFITNYININIAPQIQRIEGVGEVEVMITLESSAEKVVEKDRSSQTDTVTESGSTESTRTSKSSSTSESSVYGGSGNQEEPYVSKEISPKVRGVLVVASGGDKAVVKQNIMEAVQALFDIDTHKIRIMKKNENQSENQEGKQ